MNALEEQVTHPKGQSPPQEAVAIESRGQRAPPLQMAHTAPYEMPHPQPAISQSPPQASSYKGSRVPARPGPQPTSAGSSPQSGPWRRSRHSWRFAVALVLLIFLLLIGGIGFLFASLKAGGDLVPSPPRIVTYPFSVGADPQINVVNDIGTIHVNQGGTGKEVTFQETRWNSNGGAFDDIKVRYSQTSNSNTINVNVERSNVSNINTSHWVDFDITIPGNTNLTLKTNTGSIAVTGISGQMNLTSNTGSITVVGGQSYLSGTSVLRTNSGSIDFSGTIDSHGTYSFLTNSGQVDVTLPKDPAFHVDAMNDQDSITIDFPGMTTSLNATHYEVYGDVGNPSQAGARVILVSKTGSISLHETPWTLPGIPG